MARLRKSKTSSAARSVTHCRGEAKVYDFDYPSVAAQHIRGLQVTVNNFDLTGGLHATADVPEVSNTAMALLILYVSKRPISTHLSLPPSQGSRMYVSAEVRQSLKSVARSILSSAVKRIAY